jgi:hypothetical protein
MTDRGANALAIAGAITLVLIVGMVFGVAAGVLPVVAMTPAQPPARPGPRFEIFVIGAKDIAPIQTCGAFVSAGESRWGPHGETCVWVERGPRVDDNIARLCAVGAYAVAIGQPCGGQP